jgi:hypothetical protein
MCISIHFGEKKEKRQSDKRTGVWNPSILGYRLIIPPILSAQTTIPPFRQGTGSLGKTFYNRFLLEIPITHGGKRECNETT